MNNIIDLYQFRRHKKIKKVLRFMTLIAISIILIMFIYILFVIDTHHPSEFPSYIEPKP